MEMCNTMLNVMKFAEIFDAHYTTNYNSFTSLSSLSFSSNILNVCQKLKHLSLTTSGYTFFFAFNCEYGPYLELCGVDLDAAKLCDLISACLMLQVVKLHGCPRIRQSDSIIYNTFSTMQHMLNAYLFPLLLVVEDVYDDPSFFDVNMKSFSLMNIRAMDNENFISDPLLSILRKSSMFEELKIAYFGKNDDMRIVAEDWWEYILTNSFFCLRNIATG